MLMACSCFPQIGICIVTNCVDTSLKYFKYLSLYSLQLWGLSFSESALNNDATGGRRLLNKLYGEVYVLRCSSVL